ncbi:hypothetical protein [Dictyobacter formicarum]|uniref:Uncharacterized protein n=1 Tax=Dictyobacter formicarum TaxID=2778368 RepID=A0ABQ3VSF6_9CHLR|nr:hypothetical protein [Dictyobacter formicarum]GHO88323.1 hypothetical protein KSZ_63290 [Dictyobacter formicarum]
MPTQEERLTTVENDLKQFKAETVRAYQDSAVDLALVKGLAMGAYERLNAVRSQIADFKQDMLDRFERQDNHFAAQDAHLDMHDKRFDVLDKKLDQILQLLTDLRNKS